MSPVPAPDPDGEMHAASVRVDLVFEPGERTVRVPHGVSLFDAASWDGIAIDSTCGGHGSCKECKVKILRAPPQPTSLDARAFTAGELADGWRLACRALAATDTRVAVPPLVTRPKAATVGVGRQVILRPAAQKRYLELAEPTLHDQATDLERLLAHLDDVELKVDLPVLRQLGRVLRDADFKVTAVIAGDGLIGVEPGDTTQRLFGIAFDLGTTVMVTLLDLSTGTPVAVESVLNAQQPFGADVISRITATMTDAEALGRLTLLAHDTLAGLTREACTRGEVDPAEVYEVALADNATMTHLVLGIDPEPLGVAPFIMSARLLPEALATDLGIEVHPRARAAVFPAFGAYVGGDITAGLLASGMDRDTRTRLFADIGTSCEIVPGNREWLLATAAPAGPAVAHADCGTHGGLDEVCSELGLRRLPGLHCYDVLAGPQAMRAAFEAEPGTYVLTDFLVSSSRRTVPAELGLDRYPQLWQHYLGHYRRRLVRLAQNPQPHLAAEAKEVAAMFGLPLAVIEAGTSRLERELEQLLGPSWLDGTAEPAGPARPAGPGGLAGHPAPTGARGGRP